MPCELIQNLKFDKCIDTLEFCPFDDHTQFLCMGTYELQNTIGEKQVRKGDLYVFYKENDGLCHYMNIEEVGILDLKWLFECDDYLTVASALANGSIGIHNIYIDRPKISTERLEVDSCLLLSISYTSENQPKILTSTSKGEIFVYNLDKIEKFHASSPICRWQAHTFEAWTATFNEWDSNVILSGGDDNLLKIWDTRALGSSQRPNPIHTSKYHSMGVCSLDSSSNEHLYTSGSFDQDLCIWDYRAQKMPLQSTKLESGIWRIKWIPHDSERWYMQLAATHAGLYVLEYNVKSNEIKTIAHYEHAKSLTYGVDWQRGSHLSSLSTGRRKLNLVSSSFYEKELHLLSLELPD